MISYLRTSYICSDFSVRETIPKAKYLLAEVVINGKLWKLIYSHALNTSNISEGFINIVVYICNCEHIFHFWIWSVNKVNNQHIDNNSTLYYWSFFRYNNKLLFAMCAILYKKKRLYNITIENN